MLQLPLQALQLVLRALQLPLRAPKPPTQCRQRQSFHRLLGHAEGPPRRLPQAAVQVGTIPCAHSINIFPVHAFSRRLWTCTPIFRACVPVSGPLCPFSGLSQVYSRDQNGRALCYKSARFQGGELPVRSVWIYACVQYFYSHDLIHLLDRFLGRGDGGYALAMRLHDRTG